MFIIVETSLQKTALVALNVIPVVRVLMINKELMMVGDNIIMAHKALQ